MKYNKYHSSKARCGQGHVHDSKKEACRCDELHLLRSLGEISELEVQKKYVLIPSQKIGGRVAERECSYVADFDYLDRDGTHVVEDVKGLRTKEYIIKRKLMLYVHGVRVREV